VTALGLLAVLGAFMLWKTLPRRSLPPPHASLTVTRQAHWYTDGYSSHGDGALPNIDGRYELAPEAVRWRIQDLDGLEAQALRLGLCEATSCGGDVELQAKITFSRTRFASSGTWFASGRPIALALRGILPYRHHGVGAFEPGNAAPGAGLVMTFALPENVHWNSVGRLAARAWMKEVRERPRRPLPKAVAATITRDTRHEIPDDNRGSAWPVVAGGRVWSLTTHGDRWLWHILHPDGHAASVAFNADHVGYMPDYGYDAARDRMLVAVNRHGVKRTGTPSCGRETRCVGAVVLAISPEGKVTEVARVDDLEVFGAPLADAAGNIFLAGMRSPKMKLPNGTTGPPGAFLVRVAANGRRTELALERPNRRYWDFRLFALGSSRLCVMTSYGLRVVDVSGRELVARPPIWWAHPYRKGGVRAVAPDGTGGMVAVDPVSVLDMVLVRYAADGSERWRVPMGKLKYGRPNVNVSGNHVALMQEYLFSLRDGKRLSGWKGGFPLSIATVGGHLVGCERMQLALWSATGARRKLLNLPWGCRAVGPGPNGTVLVAAHEAVGAYLLAPPAFW